MKGSPPPSDLFDLPLFSAAAPQQPPAPTPRASKAKPAPAAPEKPALPAENPQWTVSELTQRIKGAIEPQFMQVWVKGEISNYRPTHSGHAYFSLKDAQSQISAAIFGWGARKKPFDLKDGLSVLCRGKVTVYQPRGSYQLTIESIEPLGAGALQMAYEQLKEKLAAQGLFRSERKRKLPPFPTRIAVVTSPTGAAIQDMLNILRRRAPGIRVTIIPAQVQGEGAAQQILRGLQMANRWGLGDVVVLARGGGSIEDLWAFNDEALAQAIATSRLPVVSAVGHEIDFTIADFAADLRAPTPSAAAEILSQGWVDARERVDSASRRLTLLTQRELQLKRAALMQLSSRLVNPRDRLREQMQRVDEAGLRIEQAMRRRLDRSRSAFRETAARLEALSPLRVLDRGFALVTDASDERVVIKSVQQVKSEQEMVLTFADGRKTVRAI